METIEGIEKANANNYLWPPIADAVDTFLRRRNCEVENNEGENYERTWRLIHIWEAIVTTLSGIAVARLRTINPADQVLRKCREHLYGRYWDSLNKVFKEQGGALDGSAVKRLDILKLLTSDNVFESSFLLSLRDLLCSPSIDSSKLILAWGRVCEVPEDSKSSEKIPVWSAMRLVNEFRNRFAHVPFPPDSLGEIADALEGLTEQLFMIEPVPSVVFMNDSKVENPLTGAIYRQGRLLRGSMSLNPPKEFRDKFNDNDCVFPALPKKNIFPETWNCQPFLFVDNNKRPYVLTRLRSKSNGQWEYTRFRADAYSVIIKEDQKWLGIVPNLNEEEYVTEESTLEDKEEADIVATIKSVLETSSQGKTIKTSPINEFEEALRHIRNEEYEPAITYFTQIVQARPDYHIGWLRLGIAQREQAVRIRVSSSDKAKELFAESVKSLTIATNHIIKTRCAQAYYERSKSYYHWGRCTDNDIELFLKAIDDAEIAYTLDEDMAYQTWIDYLRRNT